MNAFKKAGRVAAVALVAGVCVVSGGCATREKDLGQGPTYSYNPPLSKDEREAKARREKPAPDWFTGTLWERENETPKFFKVLLTPLSVTGDVLLGAGYLR
jgi:hypothetical protein